MTDRIPHWVEPTVFKPGTAEWKNPIQHAIDKEVDRLSGNLHLDGLGWGPGKVIKVGPGQPYATIGHAIEGISLEGETKKRKGWKFPWVRS